MLSALSQRLCDCLRLRATLELKRQADRTAVNASSLAKVEASTGSGGV